MFVLVWKFPLENVHSLAVLPCYLFCPFELIGIVHDTQETFRSPKHQCQRTVSSWTRLAECAGRSRASPQADLVDRLSVRCSLHEPYTCRGVTWRMNLEDRRHVFLILFVSVWRVNIVASCRSRLAFALLFGFTRSRLNPGLASAAAYTSRVGQSPDPLSRIPDRPKQALDPARL